MRRRSFPAPAYRYMLNVEIVDYTESRYVSLFNDEAERLLGIKAEELNALRGVRARVPERAAEGVRDDAAREGEGRRGA